MDIAALLTYIETGGFGIKGESLFRGFMPSRVKEGVLLVTQVPSLISPYTGLRQGAFQLIARASNEDRAREIAATIIPFLDRVDGLVCGTTNYHVVRARHDPLTFPASAGADVYEASVNFDVVYTIIP